MSRMVVLAVLLFASPAASDWLVLRDGSRVETEGAWSVKGRQVVFTRAGGSLSALRLADVDLEASEKASADHRESAPKTEASPPPARREAVRVFTDKDIPQAVPDPETEAVTSEAEADAAEGGATSDEAAASGSAEPVVLEAWNSRESGDVDGLEIYGSVRNTGEGVAAAVSVQVRVADEEGNQLVDARAFLQHGSLAAGQSSTFRALLPGIYTLLAEPTFEITSDGFTIRGPGAGEDETEEAEGEAEADIALVEG